MSLFFFSYSSIRKLLYDPRIFYNEYILNNKEDRNESFFLEGKVIHCLLFQPMEFENMYCVSYSKSISPNVQLIVNKLFNLWKIDSDSIKRTLDNYVTEVEAELKEMNLYQSIKDTKLRLAKVINDDSKQYWNYLLTSNGKTIIDRDTLDYCNKAANLLRTNPIACASLGLCIDDCGDITVKHEYEVSCELSGYGLKGIIDSMLIDGTKKEILITDFKTTNKDITDFQDTLNTFMYWLQAAVYYKIIRKLYGPEWTISFNFVVIDRRNNIYTFPVTPSTMNTWLNNLEKELVKCMWHMKTNNFNLPYLYATNQIKL
jgi:hypothetical protein